MDGLAPDRVGLLGAAPEQVEEVRPGLEKRHGRVPEQIGQGLRLSRRDSRFDFVHGPELVQGGKDFTLIAKRSAKATGCQDEGIKTCKRG